MNNSKENCYAVSFDRVDVSYGIGRSKVEILKNVSLNVSKGTIFGLLGPSGCGKTTLLKCIFSNLKPSHGTVKVFNKTPGTVASKIPGTGIGYMPQEIALYPELTIGESLAYFGGLTKMEKMVIKARTEFLIKFLNLPEKGKFVQNLSGGEQRRVSFAIALMHQPPLIILDEPTVGVDPVLRRSIWNYLLQISSNDDVTVVITTHYIEEAKQANKIAFMRDGNLLAEDQPDLVMNRYNLSSLEDVFLKICDDHLNVKNNLEVNNKDDCKTAIVKAKNLKNQKYFGFDRNSDAEKPRFSDYFQCPSGIRIKALAIKNYIKIWRTLSLFFSQLLSPVIQITLFFWAFGSDPHDLNVAVFNQDNILGTRYLHFINNHTIHQIPVNNLELGEDMVIQGKAWAVIHILPNFTSTFINNTAHDTLTGGMNTQFIHVRHDNTDQQITYSMQKALYEAFDSFATDASNGTSKATSHPVVFDEPIYGPVKSTFTDYLVSGVIINTLFSLSLLLTSVPFVMDKKEGLLSRSYISGATTFEVQCGYIITQMGIMFLQSIMVLLIAIQGFNAHFNGNFFWVILLCLSQGLCGMSCGFFIAAVCNDGATAIILAAAIHFPLLLISGAIWPVESMPNILRNIGYFFPITLPVSSMRWIASHGKGITCPYVWHGFAVTWSWIICLVILSTIIMRFKK